MYDQLLAAVGAEPAADAREKPSCCDEEGAPPVDDELAEAIGAAVEASARRSRERH